MVLVVLVETVVLVVLEVKVEQRRTQVFKLTLMDHVMLPLLRVVLIRIYGTSRDKEVNLLIEFVHQQTTMYQEVIQAVISLVRMMMVILPIVHIALIGTIQTEELAELEVHLEELAVQAELVV